MTHCNKCTIGKVSKAPNSTLCTDCQSGRNAKPGSASCSLCLPGKFASKNHTCEECLIGFFSQDTESSSCKKCVAGRGTVESSSTFCSVCAKGKSGTIKGTCEYCPKGTYQDTEEQTTCKACPSGWSTTSTGNARCDPPVERILTAEDCDFNTQYLNDSSSDPRNHSCAPCPLGASCEGPTAWSGVTAVFGFYRVHEKKTMTNDTRTPERPPNCLVKESTSSQPGCAFHRCLYPAACLGKTNNMLATRFLESNDFFGERTEMMPTNFTPPASTAAVDLALHPLWRETCDEDRGYANNCTDNGNPSRCRLCGTCKAGYKRHGGGTKCKKCPEEYTNRALLVIGFLVMLVGSAVLIYMTIKENTLNLRDQTSDALKKLVFNFLQITSLAAGLPLQWPIEVETMFEWFNTMSSAGSNLLIPDCELSHMKTADVYFAKQIAFAFFVPVIVFVCVLVWTILFVTRKCSRKMTSVKAQDAKDYAVLSSVLMIFLSYPLLTRAVFSMFKCPMIDDQQFLVADLQEKCFVGRHLHYFLALTIPQIVVYILGLPAAALVLLLRSKHRLAKDTSFQMRYGFLFFGYRHERAWWEAVIAMRKVVVVLIGTFGSLVESVNLQA